VPSGWTCTVVGEDLDFRIKSIQIAVQDKLNESRLSQSEVRAVNTEEHADDLFDHTQWKDAERVIKAPLVGF